jgi:hypothetical protein
MTSEEYDPGSAFSGGVARADATAHASEQLVEAPGTEVRRAVARRREAWSAP